MKNTMQPEWNGFVEGKWSKTVNVRDFIQLNYTPYEGDNEFLAGPTEATSKLWDEVMDLFKQEREKDGVLDMDTEIPSTVIALEIVANKGPFTATAVAPGYIS